MCPVPVDCKNGITININCARNSDKTKHMLLSPGMVRRLENKEYVINVINNATKETAKQTSVRISNVEMCFLTGSSDSRRVK